MLNQPNNNPKNMSSALKPVLTSGGVQNPPPQLNKPMQPSTYGQPQNLAPNPHGGAAPAHQPNYYSLNVPNAPQHYPGGPPIPASNHPVASQSHASSMQSHASSMQSHAPSIQSHAPSIQSHASSIQSHAPSSQSHAPKGVAYPGSYQPNLGHPPNVHPLNVLPPVSQTLPPTQQTSSNSQINEDRPQSNGTPEVKSPPKANETPSQFQNHVAAVAKEKPAPVLAPPVVEKTPAALPVAAQPPEQKQSPEKTVDSSKQAENAKQTESASLGSANAVPAEVSTAAATVVASAGSGGEQGSNQGGANASPAPAQAQETKKEPSVSPNVVTAPPPKPKEQVAQPVQQPQKSSTLKLATTPRTPARKPKPKAEVESPKAKAEVKSVATPQQKSPTGGKSKRARIQTQPYQSPLPEIEIISKISAASTPNKNRSNDDKLIIFYKNEFLAVRNLDGGFYICQAVQNIYKTSPKIKIRWLSQESGSSEIYTPDFYDYTDFDCILTNLNLIRVDKGKFKLPPAEKERTDSILKRALAVEKGESTPPSLTEEHPDGLDLSLYKEESQLKKRKAKKRKAPAPLASTKNSTKKSPESSKVRKIAKPAKAKVAKKPPKVLAKKAEVKRAPAGGGRAERAAKRRGPEPPVVAVKSSPVVDQKKAKVLAKVARKTVVSGGGAKSAPLTAAKSSKVSKPALQPAKVQKAVPAKAAPAPTRKTKRSSRK